MTARPRSRLVGLIEIQGRTYAAPQMVIPRVRRDGDRVFVSANIHNVWELLADGTVREVTDAAERSRLLRNWLK